ncbi:MAG: hypothetical protein FJ316_03680 [SAR202 cluster bacterium]|nr:hypothetical protein [SAR202 cluster bacterium]
MSPAYAFRVPWQKTRWSCDPEALNFKCTAELAPLDHFIGQRRALESIRFGLEVDKPGYNLFVTGLTGTGKASIIRSHLQQVVEELQKREGHRPISDWCYVHHFDDPDRPQAISLPPGMGRTLRTRLTDTLRELREEIPKVFRSEEFQEQQRNLEESGRQAAQQLITELEELAQRTGFAVHISPAGITIFPVSGERPMTPEEYQALPPERRKALDEVRRQLMQQTQATMMRVRDVERDAAEKIHALERVAVDERVSFIFQELVSSYQEIPQLQEFVTQLIEYVLDNLQLFRETGASQEAPAGVHVPSGTTSAALARNPFLPFEVNLLVDNSTVATVPVIIEPNPNWGNLFGRIERRAVMGTYFSDHTMLKPGSVHLANGGYLVFNARDMLMYPGVWEGLKRVIRNRAVSLEDPSEQTGFFIPQGLRPQPIPLDLKVIITGDEMLYRLFTAADVEDFWDLFKVKAEFDSIIALNQENLDAYCAFICRTCQEEKLLPFDASAAAQVLEYAARLVADQHKLSARFGQIKDVVIESDHWAKRENSSTVLGKHVEQALEQKLYRLNLIQERLQDMIAEGTVLLSMTGSAVGQVNGLSVYDLGDFAFGLPTRITAQTFAGRSQVINIERESALSGPIHSKGVLILSGYLGAKYGRQRPLTLSASLCFEQSYGIVEGDSASSAELYAILSSLSGLPINQNIAVTGSVNQKGEIQPIGGVNEKIEGVFEVCRRGGLTGDQGVMIPDANQRHLMLREEVVEAVRDGKFHIYAIKTIDQGIELLMGRPAGDTQPDGSHPPETVNYLVDRRLTELNQSMRGYFGELLGNQ